MRIAKFLADAGVASRRAAEELVRGGRVALDGELLTDVATDVDPDARVTLDGVPVAPVLERVVVALHKPLGVVSTAADPQGRPTVVELVASPLRLYPVGRLDIDTSGLILLTNDGSLAHRLTHPSFEVGKTYRAVVRRPPVREPAIRSLRRGVTLDDGATAPAGVRRLAPDTLEITIHEGRHRQVRRMCEAVGHPVAALERVAIGRLALGRLATGAHRRLSSAEVAALNAPAAARPSGRGSSARRGRRSSG